MNEYRSNHPNEVHQLGVSVSKHFYAGKDGLLKYQKKPFEVSLGSAGSATRQHLVIYTLRDHCSGLFYVELALSPKLPPLESFLARAWSPKEWLVLHGLPDFLMLPSTVDQAFPGVAQAVEQQGVQLLAPASGFQSGAIKVVKEIEGWLMPGNPVDEALGISTVACQYNAKNKSRAGAQTKAELWQQHVPPIKLPSNGFGSEMRALIEGDK